MDDATDAPTGTACLGGGCASVGGGALSAIDAIAGGWGVGCAGRNLVGAAFVALGTLGIVWPAGPSGWHGNGSGGVDEAAARGCCEASRGGCTSAGCGRGPAAPPKLDAASLHRSAVALLDVGGPTGWLERDAGAGPSGAMNNPGKAPACLQQPPTGWRLSLATGGASTAKSDRSDRGTLAASSRWTRSPRSSASVSSRGAPHPSRGRQPVSCT